MTAPRFRGRARPRSPDPPPRRRRVLPEPLFRALVVALAAAAVAWPGIASAQTDIPSNWELTPSGLDVGDRYRLLIATSGTRHAWTTTISNYNTFVQNATNSGHRSVRGFSSGFRVVGSTADIHARDNTSTTYTSPDKGLPIYWLAGNRLADHHEDFYDGDWDDEVNATNASGSPRPFDSSISPNRSFTGSNHNGLSTLSDHVVYGSRKAPRVTIAAAEAEFILGLEDVIFRLDRTDSSDTTRLAVSEKLSGTGD